MGENLYRRPNSPYWWCIYYDANGVRQRVSTKCTDKRAADVARRRFERSGEDSKKHPSPDASGHTVEEALTYLVDHGCHDNAPSTVEMYGEKGSHVARLLGDLDCAALLRDDVQGYITTRTEEGASQETVRKEIVTLRRALELAESRKLAPEGILGRVPKVRVKFQPRDRHLTLDEYHALLPCLADDRKRFWISIAIYTGANLSEVRGLQVSDVDNPKGWIFIRGTKTGKRRRRVPIATELRWWLDEYAPKSGALADWWFSIDRDIKRACEKAGIAPVSTNDLRRTFASWLVQSGTPLKVVASLMGHSSTRMVDLVYGQLVDDNLVAAVASLPCDNHVPRKRSRVTKNVSREKSRKVAK